MEPISMELWGKDHWTTYAYIANRMLNHSGRPEFAHMRTDPDLHPQFVSTRFAMHATKKYPTRIKGGEIENHDDWSCVEDFISAGLVTWEGTGIHPIFQFTDAGWEIWHQFNKHIAENPSRWSTTFVPRELAETAA